LSKRSMGVWRCCYPKRVLPYITLHDIDCAQQMGLTSPESRQAQWMERRHG
jgi:hypothetical protein